LRPNQRLANKKGSSGCMFNYKEIATPDKIKSYINKFWILDHANSSLYSDARYALPNGCCTLAFINGEGLALERGSCITNITSGIYFVGQITKRLKIIVKPHTKAIMAQLTPWTPTLITKHSLSELTDQFAELELVNKELYKTFCRIEVSDEQPLVQKIYYELESYFCETGDSSFIRNVINTFTTSLPATSLKISDIAIDTGYSKRYIEKKFAQSIGLSPKEMYSILRLRNIVDVLKRADSKSSLTQLALEFGYFDQSHFIKAYTGMMNSLPGKFEVEDYILPLNQ
jgi:AraC-like DNA-binding protein